MKKLQPYIKFLLVKTLFLTVLGQAFCHPAANLFTVASLTVEGRDSLLGTDITHPRLSWKIASQQRNFQQQAYQILVASSAAKLGKNEADIWNSGKVISDNSINVLYSGTQPKAHQAFYWKVIVWSKDGSKTISNQAYWSTGILQPTDWKAKWVGLNGVNKNDQPDSMITRLAARNLRKEFAVQKTIVSASAYICGLGLYELYVNGKKVGLDVLAPTVSEYNKKAYYNTYDVTRYLKNGNNCIGVVLGNGRFFGMRNYHGAPDPLTQIPQRHYGLPQLLAQVRIVYSDGSVSEVLTDESWKVTDAGPIVANSEFDGEDYDARKEMSGWNMPGFNAAGWKAADIMPADNITVLAQPNENIRVKQILRPVSIKQTRRGTYMLDMGQNMVGWVAIKMKAGKGDTISMRFAEKIKGGDSLYLDNMRKARVTDNYIAKGALQESYEPTFTYHGFRYVEVKGLKNTPKPADFEGKVIYDDIETTGTFETSNATINAVFKNSYWTIRGNYRGMPTDCPQRDERVGWLGDRVISSYGESFLFDNSRLYAKWLDDIKDAQKDNGSLPDIAPTFWDRYADNVTYPSAFILIPEMLRKQFGDTVSLAKQYPFMKKWLLYMWENYNENGLVLKDNYGDWCVPPESLDIIWSQDSTRITNGGLLASAYYYYCLNLMKHYATIIGSDADAKNFDKIAQTVLAAFNKKFYNSSTKSYANNTVTANLLPLSFGMVPPQDRPQVFNHIKNKLKEFNNHVNSGIIGGMWLMRGLSDNGAPELAYKLATNTTYPSWGYMVGQGATTIWELWNGDAANPMMNSGNHQMLLGDLLVWNYEYLAGIKTDDKQVAFKKLVMKPIFPEGLNHVKASMDTKYGLVKSHWRKTDKGIEWDITVPANSSADIYFPTADQTKVSEGSKSVSTSSSGFKSISSDTVAVNVGSGIYNFFIKY